MRRRVKSLERIEQLRKHLHEIAQWRKHLAAHERAKIESAHAEMVAALSEDLMAYGAPAAAGARRVRRMEQDIARASAATTELTSLALEQGRLAKLAEHRLDAVRETLRIDTERRGLRDLIDACVGAATVPRKD